MNPTENNINFAKQLNTGHNRFFPFWLVSVHAYELTVIYTLYIVHFDCFLSRHFTLAHAKHSRGPFRFKRFQEMLGILCAWVYFLNNERLMKVNCSVDFTESAPYCNPDRKRSILCSGLA